MGRIRKRVIRIFVSSTFSDMTLERNGLQQYVFPGLQTLCAEGGFEFEAIDLRWGVSQEASHDQRTMRICFEELRRSQEVSPRPNFIILLGDRYGWRPLPEEISALEFEILASAAIGRAERDLLLRWYRRDENAIPRVHCLQPRSGELAEFRDPQPWNEVERQLRELIDRSLPDLRSAGLPGEGPDGVIPATLKFTASATEQEIWRGALAIPDAHEHVFALFRNLGNLEGLQSATDRPGFVDADASGHIDRGAWTAQQSLKAAIRDHIGGKQILVCDHIEWRDGRIADDHITEVCTFFRSNLETLVRRQMEEYQRPGPLAIERQEHRDFGERRTPEGTFVGREDALAAIRDYVSGPGGSVFVVHGDSGCGKTALLTEASRQIAAMCGETPILRLIGANAASTDIRSLLTGICRDVRHRTGDEGEPSGEFDDLVSEFRGHLTQGSHSPAPVVIMLDALDQLSDNDGARDLNWLPTTRLSENVRVIVSCLSDRGDEDPAGAPWRLMQRRQHPDPFRFLLGAFSTGESRGLLDRWLDEARRTLTEDQRRIVNARIDASPTCRQPLYLRMVFEAARLWPSWHKPAGIAADVPGLIRQLLDRLADEANHGPMLIERALCYLCCARHGLTEPEVRGVLRGDSRYFEHFLAHRFHELPERDPEQQQLPVAVWSRLYFDLAPYLVRRSAQGRDVLAFYHRQVGEEIRRQYLSDSETRSERHQVLADFFSERAVGPALGDDVSAPEGETPRPDLRALVELPWHLSRSGRYPELCRLLCRTTYVDARCCAIDVYGLLEDFELIPAPEPTPAQHVRTFVLERAQRLWNAPHAYPALLWHEGTDADRELLNTSGIRRPWIHTSRVALPEPPSAKGGDIHVHVRTQHEFARPSIGAVAGESGLAFVCSQLGRINIVDLERSQELPESVPVRSTRILRVAVRADAAFLAVAAEDSQVEIVRLNRNDRGLVTDAESVATLPLYLPEYEPPCLTFCGGQLWFQSDSRELTCCVFQDGRLETVPVTPGDLPPDAELSGCVPCGDRVVATFRCGTDTRVFLGDRRSLSGQLTLEQVDVVNVCPGERSSCVVALTDQRLAIFECRDGVLRATAETHCDARPQHVCATGGRVLWVDEVGRFHAWGPDDEVSIPISGSSPKFAGAQDWTAIGQGESALLTRAAVATLNVESGSSATQTVVQALYVGEDRRIDAIVHRDDGFWHTASDMDAAQLIVRETSPFAVYGRNNHNEVLSARLQGQGYRLDLSSGMPQLVTGVPGGISAIAGLPGGSFWLSQAGGQNYVCRADDVVEQTGHLKFHGVTGGSLHHLGEWIVWKMTCLHGKEVHESRDVLVFFRPDDSSGVPTYTGHAVLRVDHGMFASLACDHVRDRLLVVTQCSAESRATVVHGSVQAFMDGDEEASELPGVRERRIVHAGVDGAGKVLWLVGQSGTLFAVDAETWTLIDVLPARTPLTCLSGEGDAVAHLFDETAVADAAGQVYFVAVSR